MTKTNATGLKEEEDEIEMFRSTSAFSIRECKCIALLRDARSSFAIFDIYTYLQQVCVRRSYVSPN